MRVTAALGAVLLTTSLASLVPTAANAAPATPTAKPSSTAGSAAELPTSVPAKDRAAILGAKGTKSGDRAWTTSGDATGLHVMVADAKDDFAWRTVATLAQPGIDTDRWVGNGCVTGSGNRLVVTYAPRSFTNDPTLFDRGGFTAVVDLRTGAVKPLPVLSTLAYFSPGCGAGEQAVLTQQGTDLGRTQLQRVNTVDATLAKPIQVPGQLTSAVPTASGIVAADDGALVRVRADGTRSALVHTDGVAYDLAPDADGGVVFLDRRGNTGAAHRLTPTQAEATPASVLPTATALGTGALTKFGVSRAAGGQVHLTGTFRASTTLPASVHVTHVAKDAVMSLRGTVGVTAVQDVKATAATPVDPTDQARPVTVTMTAPASGRSTTLLASPEAGTTGATSGFPVDALPRAKQNSAQRAVAAAGSPTNPVEAERTCSVPRNDPANQAMQPKPRQVEWAVDQAITNTLTVSRPANWKNLGMPAYTPQGLFPSIALSGGGRVPSQVMMGVLAQESNLWQAPGYTIPGVTANPLIGNYYGLQVYNDTAADDFTVNFANADCGYGVAQVTDGMRLAGKEAGGVAAYPYQSQRAVALDFAANVAAGLRILQTKWNQTYAAGLKLNNADPAKIENWFYAVWAYNSGLHPQSEAGSNNGAWGLGWSNNPANPSYPANRSPFLEYSYDDARTPQQWPYPEKIMGWAGHPVEVLESPDTTVAGYRAAYWNGDATTGPANRAAVKPPVNQFCDSTNNCVPGQKYTPTAPEVSGEPAGPCAHKDSSGRYDLKCWYNKASTWKSDCSYSCGNELLRFDPNYAYQDDGTAYPPNCSRTGLPSGALIIDDQPDSVPSVRPGCTPIAGSGSFALTFGADASGNYPSKTDFHQLGAGFNGHFWFAHTRAPNVRGGSMNVTGTWTLNKSLTQWARVMVHTPDHGAQTQQARYKIDLGNGVVKYRTLLQRTYRNQWQSLGVFPFSGTPKISLSSVTFDGDVDSTDPNNKTYAYKNDDIAFDAVAFQPLSAKPKNIVVAMGDSYSSGEAASADGGGDYYRETNNNGDDQLHRNACHRSPYTWSRVATLADSSSQIGARSDSWDPALDYHLIACSGAQTENLLPDKTVPSGTTPPKNAFGDAAKGQWAELSQIDKGYLDENTTLVSVSIGGNDARFADVIAECVLAAGLKKCQDAHLGDDSETVKEELDRIIPGPVEDSIVIALGEIHKKAPNAKIVLMGYPPLLENDGQCVPGIGTEEAPFLNDTATLLATHMSEAVDRANAAAGSSYVKFSDPKTFFAGQAVCGDPETINGIVTSKTAGEQSSIFDAPTSQQSFHPKITGYRHYGDSFNATLRALGL